MTSIPTIPPTTEYPYPLIHLDTSVLVKLVQEAQAAGVHYGLGAKAAHLGDKPGVFGKIDCSGWARLCIFQASGGKITLVDGSVNQHDEIAAAHFKVSASADAGSKDGRVRIGFLRPQDTDEGIGHVLLILNGETIESYGGHGPGRREWGSRPWMSKMTVYVLTV